MGIGDVITIKIPGKYLETHNWSRFKSEAKKLLDKKYFLKDDDNELDGYNLLSNIKSSKGGVLEMTVNASAVRYLVEDLDSRGFTQYHLTSALAISGTYAQKLYILCKQFKGKKGEKGRINNMPIERFKETMGVPDSYRMTHIKERVIVTAQKELKKSSDIVIKVKYHSKGSGKAITHLTIDVYDNNDSKKWDGFDQLIEYSVKQVEEAKSDAQERAKKRLAEIYNIIDPLLVDQVVNNPDKLELFWKEHKALRTMSPKQRSMIQSLSGFLISRLGLDTKRKV